MEVAPDFFGYFDALEPVLQNDSSLYCVSAWNDHGMRRNNASELRRTSVFPGLGWMLTRRLWNELRPKWPAAYWDDWLRENEQRKDRDCIHPAVSRTKTFGLSGASFGQFYNDFLKDTILNTQQKIDWSKVDMAYLEKAAWERGMKRRLQVANTVTSLEQDPKLPLTKIFFRGLDEYQKLAKQLRLMEDLKLGQPRGSWNGILPVALTPESTLLIVNAEGSKSICPSECICSKKNDGPFYLVGFINVRLYPKDKQKWTTVELVQWLQYMRWAGVEKMIVYDNYNEPEERQLNALKPFIDCGFVEWIDWSDRHPYDIQGTQMNSYYDGQKRIGGRSKYLIHFDMDEYPTDPKNSSKNFLWNTFDLIREERSRNSVHGVGAFLATNIVYGGNFNYSRELVIDRLEMRTNEKFNHLTKPVYYVPAIAGLGVHTPSVLGGYEVVEHPRFYMAHIWGPRLGDFSGVTPPEWLAKMSKSTELRAMSDNMLTCKARCNRIEFPWVTEPYWDKENKHSRSPISVNKMK